MQLIRTHAAYAVKELLNEAVALNSVTVLFYAPDGVGVPSLGPRRRQPNTR